MAKVRPIHPVVKLNLEEQTMTITLPMCAPRPSKSNKNFIIATTSGAAKASDDSDLFDKRYIHVMLSCWVWRTPQERKNAGIRCPGKRS